jgi:hypothetical protein
MADASASHLTCLLNIPFRAFEKRSRKTLSRRFAAVGGETRAVLQQMVSVLVRRLRSRAVVELENLALRHQLHVLRRQRPARPQLFMIDRLLWVWLYRLWPRCLDAMVLVRAGHGRPMAPSGLPPVLAMAFKNRTANGRSRSS